MTDKIETPPLMLLLLHFCPYKNLYADDTSALVMENIETELVANAEVLLNTMETWFHDNPLHNKTNKMESSRAVL